MESGPEYESLLRRKKKRARCCRLLGLVAVLLVVAVLAVSLGVVISRSPADLRSTVIARCEQFVNSSKTSSGTDCQRLWSVFEGAFVGKDPCNVPPGAYDSLISTVTQTPVCNRMLFWSKTKTVVHEFTEKRDCFETLEDTLLGSVLDGLAWCGKEGSSESFTSGCPGWSDCVNNPVRSFWNRASAAFADVACGDVTAMLNGSLVTPFSPTSIFASIEVKRFNSTRMNGLTVVLVTKESDATTCENPSLKELQKELDPKLKYTCKEVPESKIEACISNATLACGACW